jgi:hypothetical protein
MLILKLEVNRMNHIKNAWKSVTIWFNTLIGIVLTFGDNLKDNLPIIQQYTTPETLKYAAVAIVVINIALRFKTNKSLADK